MFVASLICNMNFECEGAPISQIGAGLCKETAQFDNEVVTSLNRPLNCCFTLSINALSLTSKMKFS